jgi:hypothetical protein
VSVELHSIRYRQGGKAYMTWDDRFYVHLVKVGETDRGTDINRWFVRDGGWKKKGTEESPLLPEHDEGFEFLYAAREAISDVYKQEGIRPKCAP